MDNIECITKKVCGFYVSTMHLVTMILPYIKNQIKNNVNFETFLEYDFRNNVENVLSNLIIKDEEKEKIININWNNNKIQKYSSIEKKLKRVLKENDKIDILVSGSGKYIEEVNKIIDRFLNKNISKTNKKEITIIDCYEVTEFDDNIREILDKHECIINTSGVHKIEEIFEDYRKIKAN